MSKNSKSDTAVLDAPVPGVIIPYGTDKTVRIRLVERRSSFVRQENHILQGGMAPGVQKGWQLPKGPSGFVNPFPNKDTQNKLEKALGYDENELSPNRRKGNFFDTYLIRIPKEGKLLRLDDANDYLFYLVALAQEDWIAPSAAEQYQKATYKFYIEDSDIKRRTEKQRHSLDTEAAISLGSIRDDAERMRQVILELKGHAGLKHSQLELSEDDFKDELYNTCAEEMKRDPQVFINVVADKDLGIKTDIRDAVKYRIFKKDKHLYFLPDDTPLCHEGGTPNLSGVIAYLKDDNNQEFYLQIKQQIQDARE